MLLVVVPANTVIVIGHRGASGYRPEHTLESYRLAAEMGADYIEPDLVSTSDGVLVARHENEIGSTTDVAEHPEFRSRRTIKTIDGVTRTGWFTEDFTFAELKRLRARERVPDLRSHNTAYDGQLEVPSFEQILALRRRLSEQLGREIGVYPETKHPTYFRSIGLALEPPLVRALGQAGLNSSDAPVFVQSFEAGSLRDLREELRVPLVQLLTAPADLAQVAAYAQAVGPAKQLVSESFVSGAHAAGLLVHPFTFRRENAFLPPEFRSSADPAGTGDLAGELRRHFSLGVDGVFTDNPDIAFAVR
jgi:glycerophosphoryl diester phosphodiesterase